MEMIMKTRMSAIIKVSVLLALLAGFPYGFSKNEISVREAEAYYGSYSAGNYQATGRSTIRGTGTIGGQYVTYYTNLPGNCIEVKSAGVEYFNCNGDYYRPYYLGNQIVYVIESP
jgi:hypothetical protein